MILIAVFILLLQFNEIKADEIKYPDSHAPISVMADHTHKKNEMMFSYRFMNMGWVNYLIIIIKLPEIAQ